MPSRSTAGRSGGRPLERPAAIAAAIAGDAATGIDGVGAAALLVIVAPRYWRYALYRGYLNLISEASRHYLGWLWWLLEPLAMTAVFYVVFRYLRGADEDFVYFLVVGVTAWLWFSNAVGGTTQSLLGARNLVMQIKLPKLMFPVVNVAAASYKQAFVFAVLLPVVAATHGLSWAWTWLPLLIAAQLLLIVAVAGAVAFLCTVLPDLRYVVVSLLQLAMFCSGIFFDIATYPAEVQRWFWLNPMAVLLAQYRLVLLEGLPPDVAWCLGLSAFSVGWLLLLMWLYGRCDQLLTRRVIA